MCSSEQSHIHCVLFPTRLQADFQVSTRAGSQELSSSLENMEEYKQYICNMQEKQSLGETLVGSLIGQSARNWDL